MRIVLICLFNILLYISIINAANILLVVYLAHPMAFKNANRIRDRYSPYFSDIVFYADSHHCISRMAHRSCRGQNITNNGDILSQLYENPHTWPDLTVRIQNIVKEMNWIDLNKS